MVAGQASGEAWPMKVARVREERKRKEKVMVVMLSWW